VDKNKIDDDSDWEVEFKKNKETKNNVETENKIIVDIISNAKKLDDDEFSDWEEDFKKGKFKPDESFLKKFSRKL